MPLKSYHVERQEDFIIHLEGMASLPSGLVILGGADRSHSGVLGPVILTSQDSGNTWHSYHLDLKGVGVRMIKASDSDNLWLLLTNHAEGADNPAYLLRSNDGGKCWKLVSVTLTDLEEPLVTVDSLEVYNGQFGLLTLKGSLGGRIIYETRDGGESWLVLWRSQNKSPSLLEWDYSYPDRKPLPLHAQLWNQTKDYYRISGLLRAVRNSDTYRIERYGYYTDRKWEKVTELPFSRRR
jgi:photosystem II stability/assembly factor-like uncharacterized protein